MQRIARLEPPGVLYHIIIRGIEQRNIFHDDKDYKDLIERLATLLPEPKTSCYPWALMPDHTHFVFRTGHIPAATLMGRLPSGYAARFNRGLNRYGQLFQNRYKSVVVRKIEFESTE